MQVFTSHHIRIASIADIKAIKDLLNSAYRGESSRRGWTTEAGLIAGEIRTDEDDLQQLMRKAGSVFIKYIDDQQQIIGCVNLQQHGKKVYMGMFSVAPQLQGEGIGKQILQAVEEYAIYLQSAFVYMKVITVRIELINWYQRHGYKDTGIRIPFLEDGLSGQHLQPLEFMVLEKQLTEMKI